jgi:hypothetical protein
MNKAIFFVACMMILSSLYAVNKGIEDTSIVRRSTPEMRTEILLSLMKVALQLEDDQQTSIRNLTLEYEQALQTMVLEAGTGGGFVPRGARKPATKGDQFDALSAEYEKTLKDALSGQQNGFYKSNWWGMRQELVKRVKAQLEDEKRLEAEKKAQEEAEIKQQEEKAAAEAAAAAQKEKAKKKKKPTK